MVEMAGPNHIHFYNEYFYYYKFSEEDSTIHFCKREYGKKNEAIARAQTPMLPLPNLGIPGQLTPDYQVPRDVAEAREYHAKMYENCMNAFQPSKTKNH
jgi:hypothetical protein